MSSPLPGVATPAEPARLRRASDGRLLAGVARGLADHLGVDPWLVRLAFVVLTVTGGAGVVLYGALWVVVPVEPGSGPPRQQRTVSTSLLLGLGGVGVGVAILLQLVGVAPTSLVPLVLVAVGIALVWLRGEEDERERLRRGATTWATGGRLGWLQVVAGGVLVAVGTVGFLLGRGALVDFGRVLLAVVVVLVGVALLVAPWVTRLLREREAERLARIRVEERAELAAQVHDSVLQTLTLIQRSADQPQEVGRLARAQERDLRRWLYQPTAAGQRLRTALEQAAAEVEDELATTVEVVCVGDVALDERLLALVQAAREAMLNAAKHGGQGVPVAVYAEVEGSQVTVFVRDRGPGFDLEAVPADRLGVRESIIGRMERHGGRARLTSRPGQGTQIELSMAAS